MIHLLTRLFRPGVAWVFLLHTAVWSTTIPVEMVVLEGAAEDRTTLVTGEVVDEVTGVILPARVYLQRTHGRWFFPESASPQGSAIRYERRNWLNTNSIEFHTTLSAHPFRVPLEPGSYNLTVERGKEYRPLIRRLEVGAEPAQIRLPLHRWVNMAERGWYSGDTHVHRPLADLPNIMLAEDLNVAFPLTYWVTQGFAPPVQGDKNTDTTAAPRLIEVDATHVIWPRNTEYEIFTIQGKNHTLGAVFALGHRTPFEMGAPPVAPVAAQAKREGALLDLDKHDWPWSMALVPVMGIDLYELANNHHWRTEFGLTNWSTPAPAFMGLPNEGRQGTELDWTLYTLQNYYVLLNCGFRLRPTAGSANGVHPVPLGFGRVYVHLPGGFSYEAWMQSFNEGRSFVTTGPMLLAEVTETEVTGTVLSEEPVIKIEVMVNGQVRHQFSPLSEKNAQGAWEARFRQTLQLDGTRWVALRCWEMRAGNRLRFAHTAPRWFEVAGQPLKPRRAEVAFLVRRVQEQIERSRAVLPPEALAEYRQALEVYERIAQSARDETASPSPVPPADLLPDFRRPANEGDLHYWLDNLVRFHRFTPDEVSRVTGLSREEIGDALHRYGLEEATPPQRAPGEPLRILPYPGGRHPRIGFLDGAVRPQRETKISVFTPWDDRSYVVVDVPEAIFSNLGLTYLAHTHIPTLWDQQGVKLPPLEWNRHPDGTLDSERTLPNGIAFGAKITPTATEVRMELWLRNGTPEKLTGLRVQNCVMLKNAAGFNGQTLTNKVLTKLYAAVRSESGRRWILTAWDPGDRTWGNEQVPCLHADPKFPDCPPGETVRLRGWLSFYEGADLEGEFQRIEATGGRRKP